VAVGGDDAVRLVPGNVSVVSNYLIANSASVDDIVAAISSAGTFNKWPDGVEDIYRWFGRNFCEMTANTVPQGYYRVTNKTPPQLRRKNVSDPRYPQMQVGADGVIRPFYGTERLSIAARAKKNLMAIIGAIPANHQIHHLVPDNVVRNHPFYQRAMRDAGYDIDQGSNLVALAERNVTKATIAQGLPTHSGSHPIWDQTARNVINKEVNNAFNKLGKTKIDDLTPSEITSISQKIETELMTELNSWIKNSGPHLN